MCSACKRSWSYYNSHVPEIRNALNQPLAAPIGRLRRLTRSAHFPSLIWAFFGIVTIHMIGAIGYKFIGGEKATWIDSLYMTFITVATIGYGETVDLTHSPGGRVFTMLIGFVGIGSMTYMFSNMTAMILESDFNASLRRRRMQGVIDQLKDHFIVCGIGRVGTNVADELLRTGHAFVIVEPDAQKLAEYDESHGSKYHLHGDATSDDVLEKAGVMRARGVFAVAGNDAQNLVISMSAKQLNPKVRVIARIHDQRNAEKARRAGADDCVSPDFTGGMRIASAMIRPNVVSFLDKMLKADAHLRVEEILAPPGFAVKQLGALRGALFSRKADFVLIAARRGDDWTFNPPDDYAVEAGVALIVITTPEGRRDATKLLGG